MTDRTPHQPRFVGARILRLEDPRLVSGQARHVDDLVLPGMLHLRLVRSQLAHATLASIDVSALHAGFPDALVFTGQDIGALGIRANSDLPSVQPCVQPILARERVRFVGEPVAAVLTTDSYSVEDAAETVFVDYDALPVLADIETALAPGAPAMFENWRGNLFIEQSRTGGDIAAARARARHVIRRTYRNQRQAGVPMECRGVIAALDPTGRILTVWSSTQIPHLMRTYLAQELNWQENRIHVIAPEVGGGFGVKGHVFAEDVLVAWLAIRTRRPIKWIEDRREHLIASIHAREHVHVLEAYVTAEGKILGLKADITVDVGAYSVWPFTAASDPGMVAKVLPGPYDIAAYEATYRAVATNKCPIGTYRGVGRPAAVFSQERLMNEIAIELGIDPITLRERNLIGQFPYTNILGYTYDKGSYAESLVKIRELVAPDVERARKPEKPHIRIGVGLALFLEQTAHGTPDFVRRRSPIETGYESAKVEMHPDATVSVDSGLQCHGQGHETTFAQLVADQLGILPADILVRHGNTVTSPYSVGTWGSRGITLGGGAAHRAAGIIRDKLIAIAAQHLQARPETIELADRQARVKGDPTRAIGVETLARWAQRNVENLPPGMEPGLIAISFVDGPPDGSYTNAVHAAVVEIDLSTGQIKLKRFVVVEDCGTIVNPMIVDGQVRGGVVQGIGSALWEHFVYDKDGQPLTTNFADYLLPSAPGLPDIEVHHIQTPSPVTPLGMKGLGEGGAIGPAAAIANAVENALGVPVQETPITPSRVWELIKKRKPIAAGGV
ncbi:MAG: xanthine dehydrogenase family protein molybdopterin-binding subunit [Proteobacteria bacterium]|nr:xanthine dehydrogenase family protein molybdopterin-binding subunit [Pseudomonadota bacterium]